MKEWIVRDTLNNKYVQELVRCKDCKNWIAGYITDQDDFIPPKCGKYHQMVGHSNDDFCSLAERLGSESVREAGNEQVQSAENNG